MAYYVSLIFCRSIVIAVVARYGSEGISDGLGRQHYGAGHFD